MSHPDREPTLYRGEGSHILLLRQGEFIDHPTRAGEYIKGPCIVRYQVRRDGSILDLRVSKG